MSKMLITHHEPELRFSAVRSNGYYAVIDWSEDRVNWSVEMGCDSRGVMATEQCSGRSQAWAVAYEWIGIVDLIQFERASTE